MILIRPAVVTDIEEMVRIAGASPSAPQWTFSQYAEVFAGAKKGVALRRSIFVALSQEQVVGFAVASAMCAVFPAEAELESLAVSVACRAQGFGGALLKAVVGWAGAQGADVLRLEVRAGNESALRLYLAGGFRETGVRRGYYAGPVEDAVCMERKVVSGGKLASTGRS